jgi:hypothetical protein
VVSLLEEPNQSLMRPFLQPQSENPSHNFALFDDTAARHLPVSVTGGHVSPPFGLSGAVYTMDHEVVLRKRPILRGTTLWDDFHGPSY